MKRVLLYAFYMWGLRQGIILITGEWKVFSKEEVQKEGWFLCLIKN